jgi:hypothetical protein
MNQKTYAVLITGPNLKSENRTVNDDKGMLVNLDCLPDSSPGTSTFFTTDKNLAIKVIVQMSSLYRDNMYSLLKVKPAKFEYA